MNRWIALGAGLAGSTLVLAAVAGAQVALKVTPAAGGRSTTFTVSFVSPSRTGIVGSRRLRDEISVSAGSVSAGCQATRQAMLPNLRKGEHAQIKLAASNWCTGTYKGRLLQLQSIVCPPGAMCPQYIRLTTLGTFSFTVR